MLMYRKNKTRLKAVLLHLPAREKNDSTCALADLLGDKFSFPKNRTHLCHYDQAVDEIKKYKEANPLTLTGDPLSWWKEHQAAFPFLSNLARNILCIPGTSVAAERVFSLLLETQ